MVLHTSTTKLLTHLLPISFTDFFLDLPVGLLLAVDSSAVPAMPEVAGIIFDEGQETENAEIFPDFQNSNFSTNKGTRVCF